MLSSFIFIVERCWKLRVFLCKICKHLSKINHNQSFTQALARTLSQKVAASTMGAWICRVGLSCPAPSIAERSLWPLFTAACWHQNAVQICAIHAGKDVSRILDAGYLIYTHWRHIRHRRQHDIVHSIRISSQKNIYFYVIAWQSKVWIQTARWRLSSRRSAMGGHVQTI